MYVARKANKDRYTILSAKALKLLRHYYIEYRPQRWLFEGPKKSQYSASSLKNILNAAVRKAKINKKVTPHTLRGHDSPKTTGIYTHISTKHVRTIQSPLDRME
jgi:integrase/recombinase XerD